MKRRPSAAELAAAGSRTIPDVIGSGLSVLFCGINPGLWSGALGQHFARPGNRFWPALHRSGFTPRQLEPYEQEELLAYGLGITNLVPRTTARADELDRAETVSGAERLTQLVVEHRPAWVAVLGVTAYRTGFQRPRASIGRQVEQLADAGIWVLPNPSGLNAHYQIEGLASEFARLRATAVGG
ncbi:MAG: G/U mismatch-specific DNA glycosylase [Geodermatophilaceae bacterium]|nr:G/U mismatch-specific DNA glycosylase [Geodermatophilaceae bacterium]